MLSNNRTEKMTQNFGRVLLSSLYKHKDNLKKDIKQIREYVRTTEDYIDCFKKYDKFQGGLCELVGLDEFQVKPYFDLDPKGKDFDYSIFDEFESDIKKIYNSEIFIAGRDPREGEWRGETVIKHSRRFYVKARITYTNIKVVFKPLFEKYNEEILDPGVYNTQRCLFVPMNKRKQSLDVPELKVIKGSLFDCCATYIEEDYEDLDLIAEKLLKDVEPIKTNKKNDDDDIHDDDDENNDKYVKLQKLIRLTSDSRSTGYDSWIRLNWCLINIGNKEGISKNKIIRLIHEFSKRSKSNYDEDKVDEWIDKHFDNVRETGYGWKYLYQTCIKEDAPDYYNRLTQSYFNVKKEFEINHIKIIHPPFVVFIDDNKENIIQPVPLCEKSYRHLQCYVKDINKKGEETYKQKRFIDKWLDDPQIRNYNKMVFKPPPLKVESCEYNTWTDLEICKTPYIQNDTVIDKFLEYANNLFNNTEVVNYIIAYFANRIQNPANRNNVCIILYGEEGDGKNRFLDIFKNIVGLKYYTELESGKQLFSTHSCIEKEKLFICVNEAKSKDNYENSEILKARITTNTLLVNPKGIQEFTIDNYCDYIMTTNNHNAVNIHDRSRRYLFVETTSYYGRNSEFFKTFSNEIVDNKEALRVIYEYLMNFDIKEIIPSGNFQNHIPITEIQETIIRDNRDKIEIFLRDLVNKDEYMTDNEYDEKKFKNSELFTIWCNWIDTNKIKNEYNSISFGTRLGILIKKKKILDYVRKDTHSNTYINFYRLKDYFEQNQ